MAEDIVEVQKEEVPFHPCLTPRGMTWFNLDVLTPVQQKLLNDLKVDMVRENNQYLAKHPEIRAIIAIFLRAVLREQPKLQSIPEFAKDFFQKPTHVLQEKIDEYMEERGEPINRVGDSALNVAIPGDISRSSIDELSLFEREDFFTYSSFTTEESPKVFEEDEVIDYEIQKLYQRRTYASSIRSTKSTVTDIMRRREMEMLFASRVSLVSYIGESSPSPREDDRDFDEKYFDMPLSPPPSAADFDLKDVEGILPREDEDFEKEDLGDDDDERIFEEIKLAQEIQDTFSSVVEMFEDEEYEEGKENVGEPIDKKSVIEADLETIKDKSFAGEEEELYQSRSATVILETMLEFETMKGEGGG